MTLDLAVNVNSIPLIYFSIPFPVPCSQMEGRVPAELKELFGEEVLDHTLVLLTCGDYLMGVKAEVLLSLFKVEKYLKQIFTPPVTC